MSDLVSIIMPSYNTAQYITETIQSVIDQTSSGENLESSSMRCAVSKAWS